MVLLTVPSCRLSIVSATMGRRARFNRTYAAGGSGGWSRGSAEFLRHTERCFFVVAASLTLLYAPAIPIWAGANMAAMYEAQTLCFELVKGVPAAAVVALLVGVVGAFIAWRQYHVARAKLNLDLFEKRYELFSMVWAFASFVVQDGPPSLQAPERIELKNLNPKIEFLFGEDIAKYVREINSRAMDLWAINEATRANNDVMRPEHIEQHHDLMNWFADAAIQGVRKRFGAYLDFEKWR
ncbi:hypothetical protein [Burkholderia pseudomallei]|uniref:hypothetical protein n=1 Tax=Burkholderia pseudomallei TaxID=28450 RepID=UPI0013E94307|nr:hypothetical protein [Burkholderia pseudomallei]